MKYIGRVFRPPSEAYSLIVQATIGCSHNKCAFCQMYKEKKFCVRPIEEVFDDLAGARRAYPVIERVFLADGDALILPQENVSGLVIEGDAAVCLVNGGGDAPGTSANGSIILGHR